MPYIGNPIYQSAFVTDQFSGDGTTTAFTMSVAPAGTTNVLVVVSGVLQDPSTYGVVGTTLTFSAAPPSGTGNISCRYLGVPVTGVTTTAYRTVTEFTATASQTTFTPPSYNVGFINVYLNGVLLGSADYTATNGTTVVLATGASAGNLVTVESFRIESVANAIPNAAGAVSSSNIVSGVSLTAPNLGTPASGVMTNVTSLPAAQLTGSQAIPKATLPTGCILQVVQSTATAAASTTGTTYIATSLTATITPSSATSKVLISFTGPAYNVGSNYVYATVYRNGSTNLGFGGASALAATGNNPGTYDTSITSMYLDSPATTSATTYTVYIKSSGGTSAVFGDVSNCGQVMILQEVAA